MNKSTITVGELIDRYYSTSTYEYYKRYASYLLDKDVEIYFRSVPTSFVYARYGTYYITISTESYLTKRGITRETTVDVSKADQVYKEISLECKTKFFHELGHVWYTDIATHKKIMRKLRYKYAFNLSKVYQVLTNIIEDIFVEKETAFHIRKTRKLFAFGRKIKFTRKNFERDRLSWDLSLQSLLLFLMYKYYNPSVVDVDHPLYTKYKEEIHTSMYRCLTTLDKEFRLLRTLAFAREILKIVKAEQEQALASRNQSNDDEETEEEDTQQAPPQVIAPDMDDDEEEIEDIELDLDDDDIDDVEEIPVDDDDIEEEDDDTNEEEETSTQEEEETSDEEDEVELNLDDMDDDFKADFDHDSVDNGCDDLDTLTDDELADDIEDELDVEDSFDNNKVEGGGLGKEAQQGCDQADASAGDIPQIVEDVEEEIEKDKEGHESESEDIDDISDIKSLDPDREKFNLNFPTIGKYKHRIIKIKDEVDYRPYYNQYSQIIAPYKNLITKTKRYFQDILLQDPNGWTNNLMVGTHINIPAVVRGTTANLFKKKETVYEIADLCVTIIVDLSGSMWGDKSDMARAALAVISKALHDAGIPFAIYCFTTESLEIDEGMWNGDWSERMGIVSLELKSFDDKFNRTKENILIMSNSYEGNIPKYSANVDEVNIDALYRKMNFERQEKDKLMIVISDGATCGDEEVLSKLVRAIVEDGTEVYGIGIQSNAVEAIYPEYMLIEDGKDLQNFPKSLNDYIKRKFIRR